MTSFRLNLRIWMLLGLLLIAGGIWSFGHLSELIADAQRGADPATALNLAAAIPAEVRAELVWLPDDADTGRHMEPFTRRAVEAAYLLAWAHWNQSLAYGQATGLRTYFAGPGLAAARDGVDAWADSSWRVTQQNRAHALQLHFYAADGSIVSFTDIRAEVTQALHDGRGATVTEQVVTAAYDVVMFLEDGNWRVRHWVRRPLTGEPAAPASTGSPEGPVPGARQTGAMGRSPGSPGAP